MKKRVLSIFVIIVLLISTGAHAFDVSGVGACTMDFESGEILYGKNLDMPLTPASLTKIMTLYIVYEKMADGQLSKDTPILISENAALLSEDPEASNIPLTAGEEISLDTLIDAMVTVSACASCTAVAEHISGSEEAFSALMNEKALSMGLQAYFTDASGLSDFNLITPRSVAALVREFIKKYPDILNYTKKSSVHIKGKEYKSTNKFMDIKDKNYYSAVDGFKTGTTTLAGKCLVSTATKNSTRVISVLMNAKTNLLRYSDSRALLDSAFERISYLNSNLFSTDIRAYVDGEEIPCCYSLGRKKALCITAENLNFYGFDTYYESESSTLYIYKNSQKAVSPVSVEKTQEISVPVYRIYEQPSLKVVIIKEDGQHPLETVFSINGQCLISLDEVGALFEYNWDADTRTASLSTI